MLALTPGHLEAPVTSESIYRCYVLDERGGIYCVERIDGDRDDQAIRMSLARAHHFAPMKHLEVWHNDRKLGAWEVGGSLETWHWTNAHQLPQAG